jgi:hypothetical protein
MKVKHKVVGFIKNFSVVSLVKVHHGGIWNKEGMFYTSLINTLISLFIVFFLLFFAINDFQ